ncbi:hypothetical protein PoB_004233100 [Plakobranchus ocellatus]|uniref:Uncharacterized protein n=1 Tax=Plakobranchus ocellatus TaxID=259542 RepID=A0AAV4BAI5_9GAST|nr:hypothetical protein PoB_004233100 [Plakobranchus ocellatus]
MSLSRSSRARNNLMGAIAFKNPNFISRKGDNNQLVSHISFGNSFYKEEEVDEEAGWPGEQDWWRTLLTRSRMSVDPAAFTSAQGSHRRITRVDEEDEEEKDEDEDEEEQETETETTRVVVEIIRKGDNNAVGRMDTMSAVGKDPQLGKTSDRAKLLV